MSDDILAMLQDSAAGFAVTGRERARKLRDEGGQFDAISWRQIADQGWLSIVVREDQGGLGLGIEPATIIAREFGRTVVPDPFVPVGVLAAACLARADPAFVGTVSLAALMAGDALVGVAWQGQSGDIDPLRSGVIARIEAGDTILDGVARLVTVPSAAAFIVSAREGNDLALFCVAKERSGLRIEQERCADGTMLATLHLDEVRLPPAARLVDRSRGADVLREALDLALVAVSAELVGVMDGALAMTLEYLRTRQQFGVAIGSFQVLQHRAVDLWIHQQISAAAVTAAARQLDNPAVSATARSIAASGVKARTSQAALFLCNQALQLHGAIGFADEYGLGLYLNRALTLSAWLGNATQHRQRFGSLATIEGREPAKAGES